MIYVVSQTYTYNIVLKSDSYSVFQNVKLIFIGGVIANKVSEKTQVDANSLKIPGKGFMNVQRQRKRKEKGRTITVN